MGFRKAPAVGTRDAALAGALIALSAMVIVLVIAHDASTVERPGIQRDIPFAGSAEPTLDLYLPAPSQQRPPLLAFVYSRFWSRVEEARYLDARFARPLQERGAAVAVIRHRLAPDHVHPTQADDVAGAVAFLIEQADRFGYDPERIYLGGHGSGAHLAALVALDPRYLASRGIESNRLAGAVGISGIYDVGPEAAASAEEEALYRQAFGGGGARRDASPLWHLRPDAPDFLVLSAAADIPGYADAADAFAEALRAAGHPNAESFRAARRDHMTILQFDEGANIARMHLLAFLGLQPLPDEIAELLDATRYWREPRFSTQHFWDLGARVRERKADERFLAAARHIFLGLPHKRVLFVPSRYYAIDLPDLLKALGSGRIGSGSWLTLTNVRGEQIVWRVEELERYRPVVVIGVDDEHNLFRVTDLYKAFAEYTWRDEVPPPPYMVRPLGGFVHFLEEPPREIAPSLINYYSLTAESFQLSEKDPLARLRDLPDPLEAVLTYENGCAYCHSLRGAGPRAGHLRARDAALHGGFALPLEEYPPEVWRRFVYEQEAVAVQIGAQPNRVDPQLADALYELVVRSRSEAGN